MLRFHASRDAAGAKAYFTQGLSREDYYTEGSEVVGLWGGKAAERLGLSGEVTRETFGALCDNLHPETGERLTAAQKEDRRVAYDISFSCPKSLSLYQALTDDREILAAFEEAVEETMQDLESDMRSRVRKDGKNEDRITGNMAWAGFTHFTSRPVEGLSDPQLHRHCFTFNLTWDAEENRWKAGQFGEMVGAKDYYQALFHNRLAGKVRALGFEVERSRQGWELKGFERETLEKFSRRTHQIEALAREKGITNPDAKDALGATTRERKREGEDKTSQRAEWGERLDAEEWSQLRCATFNRNARQGRLQEGPSAASCLDHATQLAFERESVVKESKLLAHALRHGVGFVTEGELRAAYASERRSGAILAREIDGRVWVTSREVLREEKALLGIAKAGRGRCRALSSSKGIEDPKVRSNPEQARAAEGIWASKDRVILLRGKAGTGKTTLMRETIRGIESTGKKVFVAAPSSMAAVSVLREKEGFENARTVQALLANEKAQEALEGQVLWIDEAGLLGARDMARILRLAEEKRARVILSGDTGQHSPVPRGDALRLLEEEAGLPAHELRTVRRQTHAGYRDAVEAISRGAVDEGFEKLEKLGAVVEVGNNDLPEALAEQYLESVTWRETGKAKGETLIASPTHAEGDRVTTAIRSKLRDAGKLSASDHTITRQTSLRLTEAERRDALNYESGQVVQFHAGIKGRFKKGDRVQVLGRDDFGVKVSGGGGETYLPLEQAQKFDLFRKDEIQLARGDRIRLTRNGTARSRRASGRHHDVRNGEVYELEGFTPSGHLRLVHRDETGKIKHRKILDRDYGNLTHGYVVTSPAAQGRSEDEVLIAQGDGSFGPASSYEQFYVSVSRGKSRVKIFTTDKAQLREEVRESATRLSATEPRRRQAPGEHGTGQSAETR
ncbi:MAG: relaxase domain-containing protein [Myxococcota bacterium]|nr:relaxase domain-containing protein [Myxococcota bacterium]